MAGYVSAARQSSRNRYRRRYKSIRMFEDESGDQKSEPLAGIYVRWFFDGKTTLKVVPIPGVLE